MATGSARRCRHRLSAWPIAKSRILTGCSIPFVRAGVLLQQLLATSLDGNHPQAEGSQRQPTTTSRQRKLMHLTLVAGDSESVPDNSPTLYKTDRGSWVVQGWVLGPHRLDSAQRGAPGNSRLLRHRDRTAAHGQVGGWGEQ